MRKFTCKAIAVYLSVSIIAQCVLPFKASAITSGPASPEFSVFEPAGVGDMVNEFSGSFTYNLPVINIPGPNGSGYPLSLSYHSGEQPEDDPSWVGWGWALNPGAITRQKRGFADDINNGSVTYWNETDNIYTVGLGADASLFLRLFAIEPLKMVKAGVGLSTMLQWNSLKGGSFIATPYAGFNLGLASLNLAYSEDGLGFSYSVNPAYILQMAAGGLIDGAMKYGTKESLLTKSMAVAKNISQGSSISSNRFQSYTLYDNSRPINTPSFSGSSIKISLSGFAEPTGFPAGASAAGTLIGTVGWQIPQSDEDVSYYGYLYSHNGQSDKDAMMDYTLEKATPFNLRDEFLGFPVSANDMFMLSGEGMVGNFRAFNRKVGHFHPREKNVASTMFQGGLKFGAGLNNGLVVLLSGGEQSMDVTEWDDAGYSFLGDGDEAYYFSFIGDQGGESSFGNNEAVSCSVSGSSLSAPSSSDLYAYVNNDNGLDSRVGRSSYIGYHTNEEMTQTDASGLQFNRYSRRADIESLVDRDESDLVKKQIGEYMVVNNSGLKYVYGLPAYAKNEKNISYDVEDSDDYLVEKTNSVSKKIGEESSDKYAYSWQLTEILTPDYIDVNFNGPDEEDFGGWTKFNYEKAYGGTSSWYHWRSPYNGLINSRGSLSDQNDNMGSFTSGDKELFYLSSIETKTHIAVFETSNRADGIDAAADDDAMSDLTEKGSNAVKKLDRIVLYLKDDDNTDLSDNPIVKRVNFEYDYSLCENIPNFTSSKDPSYSSSMGDGKLTLKKVWFEFEGVYKATISPYEFEYSYPTTDYPAPYDELEIDGTSLEQNPSYSGTSDDARYTDAWGNHQFDGATRLSKMNPWVNQSPGASYDPAAYHLKRVVLPTQGEIHIQYEQNRYTHVQDRKAMAMLPLSTTNSTIGELGDKYYIDVSGLSSETNLDDLENSIREVYINGYNGKDPEKMYFKFLYDVTSGSGDGAGFNCYSDYVSGYVNVVGVGQDGGKLYVELGSDADNVPHKACTEFYKSSKSGLVDPSECDSKSMSLSGNDFSTDDAIAYIYDALSLVSEIESLLNTDVCKEINYENSYLKIPLPNYKLGGGARVKRILTYNPGIDLNNADASLFGKEYVYETLEGECSGVASNEPSLAREENPLIGYLDKRKEQSWTSRIIVGKDKEQFEGPIGESFLPAPSVGYSRVVTKNIYEGKTNDGFSVKEYYTTKDRPFDGKYGNLGKGVDYTEADIEKSDVFIPAIVYNKVQANAYAAQGYCFILSDVNGKPKSTATYSGSYDYINNPDKVTETARSVYNYYGFGEEVPTVTDEFGTYESYVPGKQSEVVMESRYVKDKTMDIQIELDFSLGYFIATVIPFPIPMVYINEDVSELYTHATTKTIFCPWILKSITTTKDGLYNTQINKYHDPNTGQAIVNQTSGRFDGLTLAGTEHNGSYLTYSFPAAIHYPQMGQRSQSERKTLNQDDSDMSVTITQSGDNAYFYFSGEVCSALSNLSVGDLIGVYSGADFSGSPDAFYFVHSISGSTIVGVGSGYYSSSSITSGTEVGLEIVQSNRTNALNAQVGAITAYGGEPSPTEHAIDQTTLDERYAVAVYLNDNLPSSGSVSVDFADLNVEIINPETGECENIQNVLGATTSADGTTSSGGFTMDYSSTSASYTRQVCDTIPEHLDCHVQRTRNTSVADDQNGWIYEMVCDTVEESISCSDETETSVQRTLTFTTGDGLDDPTADPDDSDDDDCEISVSYDENYRFYISPETGRLMYGDSTCVGTEISCIEFCPQVFAYTTLDNIISAQSSYLTNTWWVDDRIEADYGAETYNAVVSGELGKWRNLANYAYKTDITNIVDDEKSYRSGIFDDFVLFNWDYEEANGDSLWLMTDFITILSQQGSPLEQENILGIKSSVKFGYNFNVPNLVASNADYFSVLFESFENYAYDATNTEYDFEDEPIVLDDGYVDLSSDYVHSGNYSVELTSLSTSLSLTNFSVFEGKPFSSVFEDDDMLIKIWVKHVPVNPATDTISRFSVSIDPNCACELTENFNLIAKTGEWQLYEARIPASDWNASRIESAEYYGIGMELNISLDGNTGQEFYFDDLRIQPAQSHMMTYVYDPSTLKVLTQFDDQHFGTYYQYNQEGKLVRIIRETERGIRTIQETQYNTVSTTR